MMVSHGGLLHFSNSEKKFFEDNLLDADDWGADLDLTLDNIGSSPSSSNDSDKFDDFGYNPQSCLLGKDDMETWLSHCSPMDSSSSDDFPFIKEEPPSPASGDINQILQTQLNESNGCNDKEASNPLSINNEISTQFSRQPQLIHAAKRKQASNSITRIISTEEKKINSDNKMKTLHQKYLLQENTKTVKPLTNIVSDTSIANKLKSIEPKKNMLIKNLKPTTASNSIMSLPTNKIKSVISSLPETSRKVVKLENGQYYVAPSIPDLNSKQVSMSKPTLKRPPSIKIENLLAEAKNFAELKNLKRQQRMMKNRESACLSRQRKKQHLKNLEDRVAEITKMNEKLKDENESLKQRINLLEYENKELREQPAGSLKVNAKQTTLLLALLLFFAFHTFKPQKDQHISKHVDTFAKPYIHRGRSLLQFDNSNINTYESLMEETARYNVHKDIFNTERKKEILRMKRRSKLKKFDQVKYESINDGPGELENDCGGQYNQSHLTRINKDLEGLVNGLHKGKIKKKKRMLLNELLANNSTNLKDSEHNCNQTDNKKSLRRHLTTANYVKFIKSSEKLRKPSQQQASLERSMSDRKHHSPSKMTEASNSSQELASLIQKSISRKADTFYVVSLLKDMLILPATNYSSKQPPKVTFMLPAYLPNTNNDTQLHDGDKLPVIQIDCNVIDTKLLRLQSSSLPKHLLTELKR